MPTNERFGSITCNQPTVTLNEKSEALTLTPAADSHFGCGGVVRCGT